MPFVRRIEGVIVGTYRQPQEGYADEWLEPDDPELVEFEAPAPPPPDRIYKSTIIRRLTESEAQVWEAALATAPAKMRLFFNSLEYFVSDDPDFPMLAGAVVTAFGPERASELLASE